ncbi:MAG: 50S ribosome-binding GTPase [Oscillospiraceae bacterium]|nr:50S ribosome-binding GTPase [Oscillospiraceae bacterium]
MSRYSKLKETSGGLKGPAGSRVIALAGSPNVGKSTVFNALTGLNQHTGNWPGKTVAAARGVCGYKGEDYIFVDLPGTYSLAARSAEEEIARDFLMTGGADAAVVVCDATCLERGMNLALQVMELMPNTVICVNLIDEARKKRAAVDIKRLSDRLAAPVVATGARSGEGLDALMEAVRLACETRAAPYRVPYPEAVERAVSILEPAVSERLKGALDARYVSLLMMSRDASIDAIDRGFGLNADEDAARALERAAAVLDGAGIESLSDALADATVREAEAVCRDTAYGEADCARDRRLDRILTGRLTGIPVMMLLLCAVLWLTITGANYPSRLLAAALFWLQDGLSGLFMKAGAPVWLHDMLVTGVYRVLAWVVSVMLPPMALFFPMLTLLEDFGYLPRVAFMLDHGLKKCRACGKQALTMCMVCLNLYLKAAGSVRISGFSAS